jgi:hypothetical protein
MEATKDLGMACSLATMDNGTCRHEYVGAENSTAGLDAVSHVVDAPCWVTMSHCHSLARRKTTALFLPRKRFGGDGDQADSWPWRCEC